MQWHSRAQGKLTCCMCLRTRRKLQITMGRVRRSNGIERSKRRYTT
eukprot:jgi/Antlo1/1028/710